MSVNGTVKVHPKFTFQIDAREREFYQTRSFPASTLVKSVVCGHKYLKWNG